LHAVLPQQSRAISEVLSVEERGRQLFDLICTHDLEGIVAKRLGDPYEPRTRWLKIKNRSYSQAAGRADLFNNRVTRRTAISRLKAAPDKLEC
jgi:ATP-dependent DNA ligase